MKGITPFLWFNDQAEEAVNLYVSIFKGSEVVSVSRYGDAGPGPKGMVMTMAFRLDGRDYVALNGGPQFTFTPAVSFVVNCESQDEIDYYWERLGAGGRYDRCGWLQDKFGLSWQIVPTALPRLLQTKAPQQAQRVMGAMLQMQKIDIAALERAAEG